MTRATQRTDYPLSLRLPDADLAIIDRAAHLQGRSRTEFMRDAAVRAAEDIILENTFIRMSGEGFDAFVAALDAPATPVAELVAIMQRPAPWDVDAAQ